MAAIDGLGSGLDTSSIIKQLMDLERLPQTRLSTQKTAATTRSTVWSQLDLAVGAVKTAAVKLGTVEAISGAVTAASGDSTAVGVSAGLGALPGTYKVEVTKMATALQLTSGSVPTKVGQSSLVLHTGLGATGITDVQDTADLNVSGTPASQTYTIKVAANGVDVTVTSGTVSETKAIPSNGAAVTVGGLKLTPGTLVAGTVAEVTVARVTSTTGTLTDLAKAVNGAAGVATATVVNDASGNGTFVLSARTTGSGNTLTADIGQVPALTTAFSQVAGSGVDAALEINDIAVTSKSNTVKDAIPGMTLTLQKEQPTTPVTVTVAQDLAGPAGQVKGIVDAVNGLFAQVTSATKYDMAARRAAPLTGNAAVRQITNDLYNAISSVTPAGSGSSLAALGISVKSDGTYAFDESKLTASLAANPTATAELIVGLTGKLAEYADGLRNGKTVNGQQIPGVITAGKESAQSEADRLQKRIDEWDRRLALTQARLTKQYTALDSALGGLKSQGTWLSGAIGSLGKWE